MLPSLLGGMLLGGMLLGGPARSAPSFLQPADSRDPGHPAQDRLPLLMLLENPAAPSSPLGGAEPPTVGSVPAQAMRGAWPAPAGTDPGSRRILLCVQVPQELLKPRFHSPKLIS